MAFEGLNGHLLIAVPDLQDPNFVQSVVLLVHHDPQGATGLILNRESNATIGQALELPQHSPATERPIYIGGPVEGPLMVLHQCVSLAERQVLDDLFFSMTRDNLTEILAQTLRAYRVFSGYSGWGAGQLEQEIAAGGWLTMPASAALVFGEQQDVWRAVCDEFGLSIIFDRTPEERPGDPHQN